jgi:hypothetical protein
MKNTRERLALMGLRTGLSSAVSVRQTQGRLYGTRDANRMIGRDEERDRPGRL